MQKPRKLTLVKKPESGNVIDMTRKLRMIRRGEAGPDEELLRKLSEARYTKMAKQAIREMPAGIPLEEVVRRFAEQGGRSLQGHHMGRTATKYALDAIGVEDEKTRGKVHRIAGAVSPATFGRGHGREGALRRVADELVKTLGREKAQIFMDRWGQIIEKMGKIRH